MSPDEKPDTDSGERSKGFAPSFTFSQFQQMAEFFKGFLAENPLVRASIIGAGIGGLFEALHVLWLFARYIFRF